MKANADPSSRPALPLIAVDWGSTNFRATLVIDGEPVDRAESGDGIRNRDGRDYDDLLDSLVGHWRPGHERIRVVMSGMIGSREGWREAPYALAPAGIPELAAGVIQVASRHFGTVEIVPGVRWDDPETGTTDVMRGEETQVAGWLASLPGDGPATLCLPGTHSKWIVCRDGRIERFRTFLTGEAFERLTRESLIAGENDAGVDPDTSAFARGVELAGKADGGMLHHLFLGRTEMLAGRVSPRELKSLVSGLLLGHEVREAGAFATGPIVLLGSSPAVEATAKALAQGGIPYKRTTEETHLAGLLAILAAIADW